MRRLISTVAFAALLLTLTPGYADEQKEGKAKAQAQEQKSLWTEKVQISGDFRYRH